ncbi:hypothetical protein [Bacteroides acidifaciens]|uniref:hypothetical protein n=1 Tax=Bacteroides acidifaciens TaxID=85831 RepID=UPI0026E0A651|nr:hypothetical protein [Bacteroides acidifaciens]
MKLLSIIIFVAISAIGAFASPSMPQKRAIRYVENVRTGNSSFQNQKLPLKANRLSNAKGNIVLTYDDSLPDSVKVVLTAAKEMWESKLPAKLPIFISVVFEPMEPDIAMVADVLYCEDGEVPGCPCALAPQLTGHLISSVESPDAVIIFNSEIDWNCNFADHVATNSNLMTMALRGITRSLGFGASIYESTKDSFYYYFDFPSYFDNMLYNNGRCLSTLTQGSSEMAQFVKSNNVYLKTSSNQYKIYAPSQYKPYMSLAYLDDNNSLMSYSLTQGDVALNIDEKTVDILRAIGWDFPVTGLNIVCDDISDNGIGSSYTSHTFSLAKSNTSISKYNWRFYLKNKSGQFVLISSSQSPTFTIAKIESENNYYININGDLEGRIECDYIANGTNYSATPFALSLELKPVIFSIDNITVVKQTQHTFSLLFNVRYAGADNLSVEVEEEYNSVVRDYDFYEPFIAHVKTGNITSSYYSWVTIIVTNKYGSTYETMEYEPAYNVAGNVQSGIDETTPNDINDVQKILIFRIDGTIVFDGSPIELADYCVSPGIYFKRSIHHNGIARTSKIVIL